MGRVSCSLLYWNSWEEEDHDLNIFSSYLSKVNGQLVWWWFFCLVFFFPVLNCVGVATEMLLIFPVPTGYLFPLVCKPFKQKSIVKSTVVLHGHV